MRRFIGLGITLLGACLCAQAQWPDFPDPDAPRALDGKVDMTGPVRRVNGKPELSGIWQAQGEPRAPNALFGSGESLNSRYFRDILADFKPGEEPLTREGAEILRRNTRPGIVGPNLKCLPDGVPHADLLPEPFKIIQTPREILMLYEVETIFRQIFTDGRKFPDDPAGTWLGYSIGKWDGDTLVVDTMGFNDLSWLDARGHGHSEDMRVQERFHRRDFGHLEYEITFDDPKMYTKPFTVKIPHELLADTDIFETYPENEKDRAHMCKR